MTTRKKCYLCNHYTPRSFEERSGTKIYLCTSHRKNKPPFNCGDLLRKKAEQTLNLFFMLLRKVEVFPICGFNALKVRKLKLQILDHIPRYKKWVLIQPIRQILWQEIRSLNLYIGFQYKRLNRRLPVEIWRHIEEILGYGIMPVYDAHITFDKCVKHFIYNRQFRSCLSPCLGREQVDEFPFYTFNFPIECV